MKKVLFIDRDGTLVAEPPDTFQVDSFNVLKFTPGVFTWLGKIAQELDYELVMVTNQDGLGTESFPEENFWPVQNFILQTLQNEGINFKEVLIDKSFPHENKTTRKPGIAMLTEYFNGFYNLKESFVIGDRLTDVRLAKNLGCKSVLIKNFDSPPMDADLVVDNWKEIYEYLKLPPRIASVIRKTNETNIEVTVNLDGTGKSNISTGLNFLDHMLEQISRHGHIDLDVSCNGDLHVDEHHTIEDTAIVLGEAINKALGAKAGIGRYGFCLPMDDCLAQVAVDFGGRNWIEWKAEFKREKIGDVPTEMFFHFFKSFSDNAKCNINIRAEGQNEHHKIEAIFKAFAKTIKMALKRDINNSELPSTKGVL